MYMRNVLSEVWAATGKKGGVTAITARDRA